MKTFSQILAEVAQPKAGDEIDFKDKHIIQKVDYPVDVEDQFTSKKPKAPKRRADYAKGEDEAVYESSFDVPTAEGGDYDEEDTHKKYKSSNKSKMVHKEAKLDPVGQEDDDIDNDGDVDTSDKYLHNRRKTIKKAMRESIEMIAEKAKSEAQQKAAGIALAVKRGDMPKSALQGASAAMYKMSEKDLEDFAKTKHKGIPAKVDEEADLKEKLVGGQKKLDHNKNGKIDAHDFHLMRKKKVKEEVEQIDEISKKTLVNYMDKSKKQTADIQKKFKKGTETKDDEKTFDRRVSGQIKALDKFHGRSKVPASGVDKAYDYAQKALRKEEVELDEAIKIGSKVRIHAPGKDYHGKVGHVGEIRKRTYGTMAPSYTVDYREPNEDHNRSVSLAREKIKLHREEVELDELNKSTLASYVKKASGNMAGNAAVAAAQASSSMKKSSPDVKRNIANRMKGITRAADKLTKEEVELDEISKSTLGRYVKAASTDAARKTSEKDSVDRDYPKASFSDRLGHKKQLGKKLNQRRVGISKAVDRLTKEEAELNELSPETLRDYAGKALQDKKKDRWKSASKAMDKVAKHDVDSYAQRKYGKIKEEVELDEMDSKSPLYKKALAMRKASAKARSSIMTSKPTKLDKEYRAAIATKRFVKEEVEQIDEISDKLKAKYLDKAVQQRYDRFKEPWDPKKEPKWATPGGKPKKGYFDQPHKVKAREKDARRAEIIDKTAKKLTGTPHYSQMSTMTTPAVHGNADDWWKGKKYAKEEFELNEEFKSGAVKLNDGSSVTLKEQDAKLMNQLFADLNAGNKKKMMSVAMKDKSGFNEILGFAREAL